MTTRSMLRPDGAQGRADDPGQHIRRGGKRARVYFLHAR